MEQPPRPPLGVSLLRLGLRLTVIAAIAFGVHQGSLWVMQFTGGTPPTGGLPIRIVLTMLVIYAIFLAIPFVPGVEIGIGLMMIEGASVAPYVFAATVSGLSLAFSVGQWVPNITLQRLLTDLWMPKAAARIAALHPLTRAQRLALLETSLPPWVPPLILRYRYVLLAVLLNLPGNSMLGGGGGIAFLAGLSGLFSAPLMLLTFALATAPVPLTVWLFGFHSVY